MSLIAKYKLTIVGVVLGLLAGYAYYYYVGCSSGSCAITSSPINSSLYGAMMGGLLVSSFKKPERKHGK